MNEDFILTQISLYAGNESFGVICLLFTLFLVVNKGEFPFERFGVSFLCLINLSTFQTVLSS